MALDMRIITECEGWAYVSDIVFAVWDTLSGMPCDYCSAMKLDPVRGGSPIIVVIVDIKPLGQREAFTANEKYDAATDIFAKMGHGTWVCPRHYATHKICIGQLNGLRILA